MRWRESKVKSLKRLSDLLAYLWPLGIIMTIKYASTEKQLIRMKIIERTACRHIAFCVLYVFS